ncbi:alpha/beta hydrolase-fold protein [Rhodopila sp.]|uniref:carboxylesterase family protein n=1 Tax=Rhodopila sp. TaxID=2480087 RepID=UPI003D1493E4
MQRRAVVLAFGLLSIGCAASVGIGAWRRAAAQTVNWIGNDIKGLRYEVLLPEDYDPTHAYPVVLYLHQLDMGDYPDALRKQVNAWFATRNFQSRHRCIVVVPMLDQTNDPGGRMVNFGGKREGHSGEDNTIAALRQVMGRYRTDPDRIYVTGNSMGGMGAWQMLLDYNVLTGTKGHIFAAGMPLAGAQRTADPAQAATALQRVPIWAIHGAKDDNVSLDWDRAMARLLAGSPSFRYTEIPDVGHDVWDSTYTRDDVWDWLFSHQAKQ